MLWIKFCLGILIILFCTFLGYLFAAKYRERKSFYAQMYELNEKYLAELKYARKPLQKFLADIEFKGDFAQTVKEFSADRKVSLNYSYLTKEERGEAEEYLKMLGRGDSHSQNGYFSSRSEDLLARKTKSEKEAKSYTDLYLKLGLLAGLAFVILIV